jgi:hypothetical protein
MTKTTKYRLKNLAYRLIHRLIKRHIYAEFYYQGDRRYYGQFAIGRFVYSAWLVHEDRNRNDVFTLTFEEPVQKQLQPGDPEFERLIQLQIQEYEATNRHGPWDFTLTVSPSEQKK